MSTELNVCAGELECQIDVVASAPVEVVHDDPVRRPALSTVEGSTLSTVDGLALSMVDGLDEDDPAAVMHRLRPRGVAVVLGVEEVHIRRRMPLPQADARLPAPSKRSSGFGLADAVNDDRAVRSRAAEEVVPSRVAIGMRSGIDEDRLAEDRALEAQEISVPVRAAHRTPDRSDVDQHLMGIAVPARTHHGVAARRKRT
jgi:hypothetical protein